MPNRLRLHPHIGSFPRIGNDRTGWEQEHVASTLVRTAVIREFRSGLTAIFEEVLVYETLSISSRHCAMAWLAVHLDVCTDGRHG